MFDDVQLAYLAGAVDCRSCRASVSVGSAGSAVRDSVAWHSADRIDWRQPHDRSCSPAAASPAAVRSAGFDLSSTER